MKSNFVDLCDGIVVRAQMLDNESSDRFWRFKNGSLHEATDRIDRETIASQIDSIGQSARLIKHGHNPRLVFAISADSELFTADLPVSEKDVAGRPTGIRLAGSRRLGAEQLLWAFRVVVSELGWTALPDVDAVVKEVFDRDPKALRPTQVGALALALLSLLGVLCRHACC